MATIEELEQKRREKGLDEATFAFYLGLSHSLYQRIIKGEKKNLWISKHKIEYI